MGLWYRQALAKSLNKEIDFDSDALTWTLHTSSMTPNQDTHAYVSDLSAELSTGGGYTSGGVAAGSLTRTYTAANSWGVTRANSTAYAVGDVVKPSGGNGYLYRAAVAGTSHTSAPTFGTVLGRETAEGSGTVVWENIGAGITVLGVASPSWASASFGPCRYLVLSDRTAGTAATQPLIGYTDFVSDKTGGGGTFQVTVNGTLGYLYLLIP